MIVTRRVELTVPEVAVAAAAFRRDHRIENRDASRLENVRTLLGFENGLTGFDTLVLGSE